MKLKNFTGMRALLCACAVAIGANVAFVSQVSAADCYVDVDASGGDGSSWAQAYTSLQTALGDAQCEETWVAEGIYKATEGTDQEISFELSAGVKVYGGFVGSEAALDERDWVSHETILNGDIGEAVNPFDNTCHIIDASASDVDSLLDGFVIEETFTDSCASNNGGGIYSDGGSGQFRNLVIRDTTVGLHGAGAWFRNGSPHLSNVLFLENYAWGNGGGLAVEDSDVTVENSTFQANEAGEMVGGGASIDGGSAAFKNVTFTQNVSHSAGGGGGLVVYDGAVTLTNVTFSGNSVNEANNGIGDAIVNYGQLTLFNVLIDESDGSGACVNLDNGSVSPDSTGNLIHDVSDSCGLVDGVNDNQVGVDPMLSPLETSPGLTPVHAIGADSPAVNAGSNEHCPPTDQRDVFRPQDRLCDVGAYEYDGFIFRERFEAEQQGPGDVFSDCDDCPAMVVIPAGSFVQGSPPDEPESDSFERPQRTVNVPAFAIGQAEVTFDEWDACVAAGSCSHNPSDSWGRGDQPVNRVNWHDAQEYVAWLSNETGHDYRLPSESEWEYATRAGTTGRFNTGDCITTDQANFNGNYPAQDCPSGEYRQQTLPVGSFAPNAFGLYDTHGNVWEWVQDCWNGSYQGAPTDGSAWMSGDCGRAVLRGGSWNNIGRNLRSATRNWFARDLRLNTGGFRVARSVDL